MRIVSKFLKLIFLGAFIFQDVFAAYRDEQSVSNGQTLSVSTSGQNLYPNRFCNHIKSLINEDKSDGLESEGVSPIMMSTAALCKRRVLPELASKDLLLKYKNHKYFKNIEKEFHENIDKCLDQNEPANIEIINKYYHVLSRTRAGISEEISKAKFLEDIITSMNGQAPKDKMDCGQIKFTELKSRCALTCPVDTKKGEAFLKSYQEAYDLYKALSEKYEARQEFLNTTNSMRRDFNDDPKWKIMKGQMELLLTQYPLLNGDRFKSMIKSNPTDFKEALLGELGESYRRVNEKIVKQERLQNCLSLNSRNCPVGELNLLIKETPFFSPYTDVGQSAVNTFQDHQACMITSKMDKDEIRSLLGGLTLDAGLTFVSMGAGAFLGLSVRGELLANLAIDTYFAVPTVKKAYDACSKEFHPVPIGNTYECKGTEEFINELTDHTGCMKEAVMAAASGLPMLPAVARYIRHNKGLDKEEKVFSKNTHQNEIGQEIEQNNEPIVTTLLGDTVYTANSVVKAENAIKADNLNQNIAVKPSVGQDSSELMSAAKKELNKNDQKKHDEVFLSKPLKRDAKNITELKESHAQANFTSSKESEIYHKLTSENPGKYHVVTSRLNLIKNCNDKLLDKDACTALGHLYQDIFTEEMRLLQREHPDLIFDSKLKLSEAAVPKDKTELIAAVEKATLRAESEWMRLIKENHSVDDLVTQTTRNMDEVERKEIVEMFASENWYTHGASGESRILAEKAAEFAAKNQHTRKSDKSVEMIRGSPAKREWKERRATENGRQSFRDRRATQGVTPTRTIKGDGSTESSSRIARWEDVEPVFDKHVVDATASRTTFFNELEKRDNGKTLKLITENNPEVGPVIKREIWELVRKKQREEDLSALTREINLKVRDVRKGEFVAYGDSPNLTEGDVRRLQKMYHDLDPLSASPRTIYRTPPEASQFKETGGFSFDLSGFGARNIQNSEVALAKIGAQKSEKPARNLFTEVSELDKPTTKLLEDTGAQIYLGAKEFAKKNGLEIKYMNRSGDDVLLSFNRELTPNEREKFLATISNKVPEKGSFRASWIEKGFNSDKASMVANIGESIEKNVKSQLKASSQFQGTSKAVNILVEQNGDKVNLVVIMDKAYLARYKNSSGKRKREYKNQMDNLSKEFQEMLKKALKDINENSSEQIIKPGVVNVRD